ncbi:MAG: hypothetical protein LBH07_01515 [Treponema sp.]|jgi:hypothetical protein|nr:hypothetical protein [Treponema sp.]
MKKFIVILLLVCMASALFAQARPPARAPAVKEKKQAVGLDLFPLVKGFIASETDEYNSTFYAYFSTGYEFRVAPNFGLGGSIDIIPGRVSLKDSYLYLGFAVTGRYYPSAPFDKFFVGTSLGFNMEKIGGRPATKKEGGFMGPTMSLSTGYRILWKPGIYAEPSLNYIISKESNYEVAPLGWQGSMRVGFSF